MGPKEEKELIERFEAIAKILYRQAQSVQVQAQSVQVKTLAPIEATIRKQKLQYTTPQLGFFYQTHYPNTSRAN